MGAIGYTAERGIEYLQTGTFEWDWGQFGLSVGIGAAAGAAGGYLRWRSLQKPTATPAKGGVGTESTAPPGKNGWSAGTSAKKAPNPWGSKGCPRHQALIDEVARDVKSRGLQVVKEYPVKNSAGAVIRKVDVAGLINDIPVEFHQVGLVTRSGNMVSREWDAILDIFDLSGIFPEFHPYGIAG